MIPYLIVPQQQREAPQPQPPNLKTAGATPTPQAIDVNAGTDPAQVPPQPPALAVVLEEEVLAELYKRYCGPQMGFTRREFLKVIRDCGMLVQDMITMDDVVQVGGKQEGWLQ